MAAAGNQSTDGLAITEIMPKELSCLLPVNGTVFFLSCLTFDCIALNYV